MKIRDFSLPPGWYPRGSAEIRAFLEDFSRAEGKCRAAAAPHAGWFFSGRVAARALSSLAGDAQTVALIGGHLPSGAPPLFALEDAAATPLGPMPIDGELRSRLQKKLPWREDRYADNTVEVLLPMARFFFPNAALLWLRLPAEIASFRAGELIAEEAEKLNRTITVIGSTDLTHYGRNYGFTPRGTGRAALQWVKEENDARFIRAVESGSGEEVIARAEQDFSSCSAGAVLGAMGFASSLGLGRARLLEYATSADANGEEAPDSFVGYAAWSFP